jgi:hypothetical protein
MDWSAWKNKAKHKKVGLRVGFRSGLEERNAEHLRANGQPVVFEKVKIRYVLPATERTYTPDFEMKNGIIVETKGLFEATDRAKQLFVKLEHPDLDIRLVFSNPNQRLSKTSKVTYAQWAESYGYKWASKLIPPAWWKEPGPRGKTGPRTIAVPQAAKDLLADPARQPLQAGHSATLRPLKVARKATRAS